MPLIPADINVLKNVARYYVLTREQIQWLDSPAESSARSMRKKLTKLRHAGYITKHRMQVTLPNANGAAPVYSPTRAGAELLASYFNDERYLATNTRPPRVDLLAHWIAINHTRIIIEQAMARQSDATLEGWINEWEVINKDAQHGDQFCLHTQFATPSPLSCSPDAAFLLSVRSHRKVFYLEQDLGTSSPSQIAARKTKGYSELAVQQVHRQHFPETTLDKFSVLFVTTNAYRCLATAKEIAKKSRPDLWLFINQQDLTAESFLYGNIVYDHQGQLGPFVKTPLPPATTSAEVMAHAPTCGVEP